MYSDFLTFGSVLSLWIDTISVSDSIKYSMSESSPSPNFDPRKVKTTNQEKMCLKFKGGGDQARFRRCLKFEHFFIDGFPNI